MKIYRVEHEESGWGPYRSKGYNYWHGQDAGHRHLELKDDFKRKRPPSYELKFGFSSPEQLAAWFTPAELRRLREHGFNVVVYDIPDTDVHVGWSQVAFPAEGRPCGCALFCNYSCKGVCQIYQRWQTMDDSFVRIETEVANNEPYDEILAYATNRVSAHIYQHWRSTLPLDRRNRALVARMVASILIEHTHWFLAKKPRGDDREVYRPAVKTFAGKHQPS